MAGMSIWLKEDPSQQQAVVQDPASRKWDPDKGTGQNWALEEKPNWVGGSQIT